MAGRTSAVPGSSSGAYWFTGAALVGFAANSLLARQALGVGLADATSFTGVRLASGALALALLVRVAPGRPRVAGGTWLSATALFAYAIAFSYAYLRIPAGFGALILFGAVQITMIGWGLLQGERPGAVEWTGLAVAVAGFVWLTAPGRLAPDPLGALLMGLAGVSWGIYSVRGRGPSHPLGATADNFLRSVALAGVAMALDARSLNLSTAGLALAVSSGALASGVGYTLWYAALPRLTAVRAAAAQLSVPVLASLGAVIFLGEHLTTRLVGAGLIILSGVALAVFGRVVLGDGR